MGLIADLTFIFLAALAGGMLARRIGQPLIVGYIIAGVAIGPFTAGPTAISHVHDIEQLAELGVVLLLFSLGLEVSFGELAPVRVVALGGATIQVVLTIALGFALALGLGWEWRPALWFGALISLSSTMVALKTIQAQGRLGTLSSRVMLGLLVVQDLAVVPLMIVLPEVSDPAGGLTKVLGAAARAAVLLAVIVGFSTRVVPPMMAFVARWNSRELFFLATTTLAVSVGYVAWLFGLSMALGAFVAGLVVSESEYAHQALSDVSPLRDLFGMLFFVSVGMLLDPALLWDQLGALALVVPMIVIGKGAIVAGVVRAFGYWNVIPLAAGLTLFQVGEFSFVLARVGRASGAIPPDLYALSMNAAIVTMALTPMISGLVPTLYERYWPRRVRETHESANLPQSLAAHVVIAGAGRVGRSIADALTHLDLPFVLIESDDRRLRQARDAGQPVIYGDATQPVVLEAAGLDTARALLVTVPAFQDVRVIVAAARRLRPEVPVIARADGPEAVAALYGAGVQEVASPEVEAAIEMTQQALMYFHVPAHEVLRVASAIRHERYERARGGSESALRMMSGIGEIVRQLDFTWIGLPAGSVLDGKTLAESRLRSTIGVTVVGIIREGKLVANPDGDSRLRTGDLVAVLGTRDQIAGFERLGKSEVRS
jgi:CPA2 family monovalent cation:H+ antiporter-2